MTVRTTVRKTVRKIPSAIICFLIRCYQWTLRPFIGMQCRFHPSCSDYALAAVAQHGALRGVWLAMRRLLRCHPLHPGGFDPVPDPKES